MNDHQKAMLEILDAIDAICKRHDIKYVLDYGTLLGAVRHSGFIPWDDDADISMTRENFIRFSQHADEMPDGFFIQTFETDPDYLAFLPKVRNTNIHVQEHAFKRIGVRTGLWVDIFVYDDIPNDAVERQRFLEQMQHEHNRFHFMYSVYKVPGTTGIKAVAQRLLQAKNSVLLRFDSYTRRCRSQHRKIVGLSQQFNGQSQTHIAPVSVRQTTHDLIGAISDKHDFLDPVSLNFEGRSFPAPKNYHNHLTAIYGDYMTPPPISAQHGTHNIS
ncbi:MAG: LicD family protein [Arcanobacterium sp.]|nr:LicD family protein [Arcanobacterium sp.]